MNFAVAAGCHSSRAAPFLPDTPAATYYTTTRQRLHLSTAKRCADKAGHLNELKHRDAVIPHCGNHGRLASRLDPADGYKVEYLGDRPWRLTFLIDEIIF